MMSIGPEEKIFSLGDITKLFQKQKKLLFRAALFGSALASFYAIAMPIKYKAKATFKESSEMRGAEGVFGMLSNLGVSGDSPQATALLQSNLVLKPLVSQFGLQITPVSGGKLGKALKRITDNLRIAGGYTLDDIDSFRFFDVVYEGEEGRNFQLCFKSSEEFDVVDGEKTAEGRIGSRVVLENGISFCLAKVPRAMNLGRHYAFSISPWISPVEMLRDSLQIVSHKTNKSIYDLVFFHRDRRLGTDILNALMIYYQRYLKEEYDQIAEAQIEYLAKRQNDVYAMLQEIVDEHTSYLRMNLDQSGFMGLDQEAKLLSVPHARLYQQSFDAELELRQMTNSKACSNTICNAFSSRIDHLQTAIQGLESQRDLIQNSLCFRKKENDCLYEDLFDQTRRSLALIRNDLDTAKNALISMETTGNPPHRFELQYDPNRIVECWAERINDGLQDREDFMLYLRNLVRLFSVREKVLQERQLHGDGFPELEGIDLDTAKQLLVAASQHLDNAKATIDRYRHFSAKLDDSSFEISSLSTVFPDPVSQKLLARAAELHLSLQDEESHSEKEEERYRREMALLRKILGDHLQQMCAVEELNCSLCQDKIAALQQINLDVIQRQISVNQEKINDLCSHRKDDLVVQKNLLENKMGELRMQMAASLPDKWKLEHLLKFKEEMSVKMLQSIGQLVESKTIGYQMHHVESKPLDRAIVPASPEKPRFALCAVAGAFIGAFGTFFLSFLRAFYRGFPVSSETLLALRYPFSGQISFSTDGPGVEEISDGDLETLRKWMLLIDEEPRGKVLSLLGGAGPDYSYTLAKLLAQSGRKVVLVRCDFSSSFSQKDAPGLLQILRGSSDPLPIRRGVVGGYDLMPTGGYTRYGTELIRSPLFAELLEQLRNSYDHILLFSRAPLTSAETEAFLRISDKAAATFCEESIELLTPLMHWAYHESRTRLTFLASSRLL